MLEAHRSDALVGRIALVTGGGSGIGRAASLAFARAGAAVVVVGRSQEKIDSVSADIREAGGRAIGIRADVTVGKEVERAVARSVDRYGSLDILFSNAGSRCEGSLGETSEAEWDRCIASNLTSAFLCAKYALPALFKAGGGVILQTAGSFALRPARAVAAYAAAKAAVVSLTRSIALDYAEQGIRCIAICPGYVDTPMNSHLSGSTVQAFLERHQPLHGVITADQVASLAVFLASDQASMITGQAYVIDGGQQIGLT